MASRAAAALGLALFVAACALGPRALLPRSLALRSAPDDAAATMQAVFYREHGGPDVLTLGAVPRPSPLPGQVLVRVAYASLNPCDFKFRRNKAASWLVPKPKIPGADIAGVVVHAEPASAFKVREHSDRVQAAGGKAAAL